MRRAAAVHEREQRVEGHRAVVRDPLGERGLEAGRTQAPPAPRGDVVVGDWERAVGHRTGLCVDARRILTCEPHAPMRPLSSPARENRLLGIVELGIGFFFAVAAGVLNPIEAAVGIVLGAVLVGGIASVVHIRAYARATEAARPAPTDEREEPGAYARRLVWPIAAQVALYLVVTAVARTPGPLAGIAPAAGSALPVTAP